MKTFAGPNYKDPIRPMGLERGSPCSFLKKKITMIGGRKFELPPANPDSKVHILYKSWTVGTGKLLASSFRFRASTARREWTTRTFEASFRKLRQIRALAPGWDSYDAEAPSELACDLAEHLLKTLEQRGIQTEFITATSDGSIMLRHSAGVSTVTWEIDGDGEIGLVVERADVPPAYRSPTASEIDEIVAELAQHG